MSKENLKIKKGGYTIIETMISISLFIVIVMSGMDALLNASLLHHKSQNIRSVMDNLSFILEDMSRNLRTGYGYRCFMSGDIIPNSTSSTMSIPRSCDSGWAISFESAGGSSSDNNDQWVYYINDGKIFKSTEGPYSASSFIQLTPDEVVIDSVSGFSVLGAEPPTDNQQQPLVTIKLIGKIVFKNAITPFSLQTSISQRLIDM